MQFPYLVINRVRHFVCGDECEDRGPVVLRAVQVQRVVEVTVGGEGLGVPVALPVAEAAHDGGDGVAVTIMSETSEHRVNLRIKRTHFYTILKILGSFQYKFIE